MLAAESTLKDCTQCGKCCIKYANGRLSATDEEIAWWRQFRPDIANYVSGNSIWVDPNSGAQLEYCPWLQKDATTDKYGCAIYNDRPQDCRTYPVNINEMAIDGCEMLEARDLRDPVRAQRKLDILMANQRPPMALK